VTFNEIVELARRMVRELRNGVARAAHWLASIGFDLAVTLAIVKGA
jgi:CheY-specific phosphatase CheX